MKISDERTNIIPALVKAQGSIGSRVLKDAKNPHFKSDYATLQQVMSQVMDHLAENGLFMTQEPTEAAGGVYVATHIVHTSGEWISFDAIYMPAPKQDAQGYGSAITYARRYALMPVFGLAPADDDGNAAVASTPVYINDDQVHELRDLIDRSETDQAKFLSWLKADRIDSIPADSFARAKSALQKKLNQSS